MEKNIFCENSIGLLILAGGRSRRMGIDKGSLKIDGETFVERLLNNMGEYNEKIISAKGKGCADDAIILPDEDFLAGKGPAAGIVTALSYCKSSSLMVVACDVPFADFSAAKKLADVYCGPPEALRKPVVAESTRGIEPLVGIYPKSSEPVIRRALADGIYRVGDILKLTDYSAVRIEDEKLININTPEDYEKYE